MTLGAQVFQTTPVQATGSLTATGSVTLNVSSNASLAVQITGTWVGTVTFEGSVDGVTYQTITVTPTNTTTGVTTTTANGVWTGSVGGLKSARARVSAYTSGTVVITLQSALAGGSSGGGGGGTASSVTINDPSVTTQKAAVNASGQLSITCANCSGSGASAVDNSAFVAGATSGAPAMGFFHSTIDAVTDGSTATLGMDAKRNLFTVLRDAAGNARGVNVTAGNALTIDGSGFTQPVSGTFWQATQPISGTVTANAGTNLNTSALALDATLTGRLPAGASPATGESNTNTNLSRIGGYNFIYNGSTWDRWTGAVTGTVTTTPPSNASTNVAQLAGTATSVNSGTKDAGTLRVVLATDQPALTNKLLVTPDSVALPANQSVNVAQLAGTATSVNSGTKDAGTIRVVIATDQVQLTNKLLVTPDSVALPANQSVNTAQFGGTNVSTGTGTGGAGIPRVTVSSDSFPASQAVTGTFWQATQPVSGTVTANAGSGTFTIAGGKTNNNAAPGATNDGVLPAVANAAAPSYTEGNQVALSTDLTGALRVSGASGGGVAQTQVRDGANAWRDVGYYPGNAVAPVADSALFQMLQQLLAQERQLSGYLRGSLGGAITSTGTALDINIRNNLDPCMLGQKLNVAISQTATTRLVGGQGGKRIFLCFVNIVAGAAEIVSFTEGTGTTCGTAETAVTGSTTAANGESYAANGGRNAGGLGAVGLTNVTGDDLCLKQSGSNRVAGNIVVAIQ